MVETIPSLLGMALVCAASAHFSPGANAIYAKYGGESPGSTSITSIPNAYDTALLLTILSMLALHFRCLVAPATEVSIFCPSESQVFRLRFERDGMLRLNLLLL